MLDGAPHKRGKIVLSVATDTLMLQTSPIDEDD